MTKLPSWKTIAGDLEVENSYLMRRCLISEGKDPDDTEAMVALMTAAERYVAEYNARH